MEMTAEKFRAEALRRRGQRLRGAAPYCAEQRAFAVSFARAGRAQGRSVTASAATLGISDPTLRDWVTKADAKPSSTLRAVVVKATTVAHAQSDLTLTLTSPSGLRVGGLDIAGVAALLRALG